MKNIAILLFLLLLNNRLTGQSTEPSIPSSGLEFSTVSLTSLTLKWNSGNGGRRLIIACYGDDVSREPTNGYTYQANSQWAQGQHLGQNNYVVYDGTGDSVTITGLTNSTKYAFKIFEYNGINESSSFLKSPNLLGSSFTAGATKPTLASSSLNFPDISVKSLTLKWNPGDGERRLIIACLGDNVGREPTNGYTYQANSQWAQGQHLGQNNYVVYDGTGDSVTITGLTNSTKYAFKIFEYNGINETSAFLKSPNLLGSSFTAGATKPTLASSSLNFQDISVKSLTLKWNPGDGERRLIIACLGDNVGREPTNGYTYQANSQWAQGQHLGQNNYVVYDGTGDSVTITGLTNSTKYAFKIFEYNGINETSAFLKSPNLLGSSFTAGATKPTLASSSLNFPEISVKSLTLKWNPGDGERRLIIACLGKSVGRAPTNGYTYQANSQWAQGQHLGENNYVVYDGTGDSVIVTGLTDSTQYAFKIYEYNGYSETSAYLLSPNVMNSQFTNVDNDADLPVNEGQVPDSIEYQALVDLYNSTKGAYWSNNTNWLSGTTSADFGTWRGVIVQNGDVTSISLPENNLIGSLPESIGDLSKLQTINLQLNALTGPLPGSIGNLINLTLLRLNHNQLESVPESLSNLVNLDGLYLNHNFIMNGQIPRNIGNLTKVRYVDLSNNSLSGTIPESIGNLSSVINLFLGYNFLSGEIPASIGNLPSVDRISLVKNRLTGNIPEAIGNLKSVRFLDFSLNPFSGELPESIGDMTNMTWLYLYGCNLEGSIPESVGNLSRLMFFYVFSNKLTGPLPESIGKLKRLERLYIYRNKISGNIPESIGSMTNLQHISWHDNKLSGTIPDTLGNLTKLTTLFLHWNQLSGEVPYELTNIPNITHINFSFNQIATFPDFKNHQNKGNIKVTAHNNKLGFNSLEANFDGVSQPIFSSFIYYTQTPLSADTLASATGQTVTLNTEDNAPHNRFQWQRLINGSWSNITGATEGTFILASVNASNAGSYRCQMTNEWVTGITIFSKTFVIQTTSEFWSVGDGNWTTDRIWSTTKGGAPITGYPRGGSKVFIVGNQVTLNSSLSCGTLEVIVENKEASLIVDGAEITVQGEVRLTKTTEGYPGNIKVVNGGRLIPVE